MKPEYEQYRAKGKGSELKAFRIPTDLVTPLERLADFEDDSLTGLVIEGLVRVLEDRTSPENLSAMAATLRETAETQIATWQEWAAQVHARDQE